MSRERQVVHAAALAQFDQDAAYFAAHQQELLRAYPDAWVAIHAERVVGVAPDLVRLMDALWSLGVPPEEAYVQHLATDPAVLIV